MQLFKKRRSYFLAFIAYALDALFSLRDLKKIPRVHETQFGLFEIPSILGMLCCAIVLPTLVVRTSNTLEKACLILTESIIVLGLANYLPEFGLAWAAIPYVRYIFTLLVCAAALTAGMRLVSVLREGMTN